jgi:Icc-related predicted phosphoesterase
MKILAIGDPHGKLPKNLKSIVKKEKIDIVLCHGDLPDFTQIRKYIFKYWNETKGYSQRLISILGKKRYDKIIKRKYKSTIKILSRLNTLGIPVFLVHGNVDDTKKAPYIKHPSKVKRPVEKQVRRFKNIHFLDYSSRSFEGYKIYGIGCKFSKLWPEPKAIKKERKKLNMLFKKTDPKRIILLTHEPPYKTKLDKVLKKNNPKYGQHIGDDIIKKFVKKYQPPLWVCGHMHESFGKTKLRKTTVVNVGSEGQYVIIDIKDGKVKLKFSKL